MGYVYRKVVSRFNIAIGPPMYVMKIRYANPYSLSVMLDLDQI